ncbi:hypothetical protein Goklo_026079 [Gossypium klotzschianum]|uniref:(+)-delta-cadinene synthase n=1 Tax=Gossypium klotzschianum TaxID=34286 RepID=A0A7J8TTN8_9ROSI|nr:hypothetical protein [Gossypium klotzschianum]
MLVAPMDTSIRKLPLIDAVQRLESFYKFKDKEGNFKSSLTNDVQGLLELYEASYMCVHGEDILDEAISFTTTHLTFAAATLDYPLSEQVTHALKQSIQRGLPRVEDLDFTRKLPYRVVEGYFWIMGVYFKPQYSLDKKMITKVISMASIVDDTYDSYVTDDELIPYTDAIERWDIKCMDQFPEFMKISYKVLLDVYEEMEQLMTEQGRQYRVEYAKNAVRRLALNLDHQKLNAQFCLI